MTIYDELLAAGLPVTDAEPGRSPHFSRLLTSAEADTLDSIFNKPVYRSNHAIHEAALATELKTITPAQAVQYIENNVTDLASAKHVLKIMARMLIALRDVTFPNLPDL